MSGFYIHVPYCRQACTYCDFHFSTVQKTRGEVLPAMRTEMEYWLSQHNTPLVFDSFYLGGGTPSLLTFQELESLFASFHQKATWRSGAEVTLEVNPEDVNRESLAFWKSLGINRFSMGVQTFNDDDLKALNRAHTGSQALRALREAQDSGFSNVSIDVMYGLPFGHWEDTLQKALDLSIPHFSAYALTVEPKTALYKGVKTGAIVLPPDEAVAAQATALRRAARAARFRPYEISNFAQPGHEAVHNSNYWKGKEYVGIGPGAHAYDGKFLRRANVPNNSVYAKAWNTQEGEGAYVFDALLPEEAFNEWLMIRLRTADGLVWDEVPEELLPLAEVQKTRMEECLESREKRGQAKPLPHQKGWTLTDEGWLWADQIAVELFVDLPEN